jgi:predicted nuclease of restriction endonuclease-like (RecB) superfamily
MLYERTAISKKPEKLIEKDLAALREEDRKYAGLTGLTH